MKGDIEIPKVERVTVAIVRKSNELDQYEWFVYLLNENNHPLQNILVTSKGYGESEGEKQKTSTLRHFFEEMEPMGHLLIEPIQEELFHLANEYWVSYYHEGQIFDKKFIFLPDSVQEKHLNYIPMLDMEGILHS